jgi:hypothetical protein
LALAAASAGAAAGAAVSYRQSPIKDVSARCPGQNTEVEQASDASGRYVYEVWIGCRGIGFARSTNGGLGFRRPVKLRASGPGSWDPAITVAPNGVVYVAFMAMRGTKSVPVVLASFDHGRTFPRRTRVIPPRRANWGDRPFIAAGPDGTVLLTWDYGPSAAAVRLDCFPSASCAIPAGDLNVVLQVSTDGARTFHRMVHLSPGFPASGGASAPVIVDASGRVDVLYEGYRVTRRKKLALGRGHEYFTSSSDGGQTWSRPVPVGAGAGSIAPDEWWIDGDIAADAAGNLYASWDTQSRGGDTGWLSYSTDHGADWSAPVRIVRTRRGPNIVQVSGGPAGGAYVGWLTERPRRGYAEYLSSFSIVRGAVTPRRVSHRFGRSNIWPGDTFGISTLAPGQVMLSWGSAIPSPRGQAEIFATRVTLPSGP